MKKWLLFLMAILLLTGCGKPEDYETMSDQHLPASEPTALQLQLTLPEDTAVLTLAEDNGSALYLCEDYTIAVQTFPSGDLDATLREVTGYGREQLQIYTWTQRELQRHECVWASVSETGDQVGKTVILDDGVFHYTVCMLTAAENGEALSQVWQQIAKSITLA